MLDSKNNQRKTIILTCEILIAENENSEKQEKFQKNDNNFERKIFDV
jgi:hypothetical protein